MNKYFLMIGACLLSYDVSASWYGGAKLGINSVNIKKNLLYPLANPPVTSANFRNGYSGFHGQLFAGYDIDLTSQLGVAVEGNADLFTGRARYTINNWSFAANVNLQEKLENGFAIFLLPAYQINPYVRLFLGPGISTNRFITDPGNTGGNVGVSGDFRKWLTGGALKAAAATSLTDKLDLLLTYQYGQYESVSWSSIEPVSGELLRGRYKPHAHAVMVGIRFNIPEVQLSSSVVNK